ncbi:hypothetical protein ACP2AV_01830 [Aliiroseovarius sp. PTFE2010]
MVIIPDTDPEPIYSRSTFHLTRQVFLPQCDAAQSVGLAENF